MPLLCEPMPLPWVWTEPTSVCVLAQSVYNKCDISGSCCSHCTEMDTLILSSTDVEVGPIEYWDWLTYQEIVDQCLGEDETAREVCFNSCFRLTRRPDVPNIYRHKVWAYVREWNVIVHVELGGVPWRGPSTHRTVNREGRTCEIVGAP